MPDDELVNVFEAADLAHLPVATLRWYRHVGKGPRSFKLGRRVLYKRRDVLAWIEEQYVAETGTP